MVASESAGDCVYGLKGLVPQAESVNNAEVISAANKKCFIVVNFKIVSVSYG